MTPAPEPQADTIDATEKVFRFLDLPAELRNHIYGYHIVALSDPEHEDLATNTTKTDQQKETTISPCAQDTPPAQPPLTRVNRQIRSEMLPLYYARTCFAFNVSTQQGQDRSRAWLTSNKHHFRHLRTLQISAKQDAESLPITCTVRFNENGTWQHKQGIELDHGRAEPHGDPLGRMSWQTREFRKGLFKCEITLIIMGVSKGKGKRILEPEEWVKVYDKMCQRTIDFD